MADQFTRTRLLLGDDGMAALAASRVAVFGIGGVGGFVVEALARCGVGALELVDDDVVSLTNANRQIVAGASTIGRHKVDVMAERIADINPLCNVTVRKCFFLPATADQFDFSEYDYVVDAVDTVTAKLQIIQAAHAAGTPVISCMGTANKLDPSAFRVADIFETSVCPLAKIIRKECHKRGIAGFKVVYSEEPARQLSDGAAASCEEQQVRTQEDERHPVRRSGVPGSVAFVPGAAGLICAGEVVKDLSGVR